MLKQINKACVFAQPSPWTVLKRYKADLDRDFFFSNIGCQTKAKDTRLPYSLPIDGERSDGFMHIFKGNNQVKRKQPRSGLETRVAGSILCWWMNIIITNTSYQYSTRVIKWSLWKRDVESISWNF